MGFYSNLLIENEELINYLYEDLKLSHFTNKEREQILIEIENLKIEIER